MRFLVFLLTFAFITTPAFADTESIDWSKINTSGLYKKGDDGFIARDVWKKYTQENALKTLSYYPNALHSGAYRSVMSKILLTESKPLDDDITSPDLLTKRLEMLIQYGLFTDAEALYASISEHAQKDFGLATIGIALTLKNGDLAPACLDIQASTTQFRDMPAWRELARYCKLRFGSNEKLNDKSLSFTHYATFNDMLVGGVRSLLPSLSVIETLVAFSDKQVSRSLYHNAARNISMQSDLFIKLALHKNFSNFETQQCFAIEAITRGLINAEQLTALYKEVTFNDDDLNGKNQAIKIHPCKVPAFFYHRFQKTEEASIDDIHALLEATSSISPHALIPFAKNLEKLDYNEKYFWRAGIIMALSNVKIPNHDLLIPLKYIQDSNQITKKNAKKWFEALKKSELHKNFTLDPALPIYYSRTISGDFSKFDRKMDNFGYENFLSLTYGEKSLHSGLGNIDAMSVALRERDVVRLFMLAFTKSANYRPNAIAPDGITGILSSLREYKLKKEKDMLAIDALHR